MEKEGLMPATEIVLWDQTQEEIIMDRENWDDEKMFGGLFWGMVTSRLYRRDFITSHGFTFDEAVPFTEDVLFLIELYGKCKEQGIHTCLDTSGIAFNPDNKAMMEKFDALMPLVDLVMLDIKHIDPEHHKELCQQPNENILKFCAYLAEL